ncbi:PaaI family thioesterase [Tomitella biformata]|uniref:PaaI family thioesterase n=1 Tax=Tomitella biformata TaxID=630403 RepID=UPI0004B1AFF7|nr:PaaI family thioesterase [Tomitella biformata]
MPMIDHPAELEEASRAALSTRVPDEFDTLVDEFHRLQSAISVGAPSMALCAEIAGELRSATARLEQFRAPEEGRLSRRADNFDQCHHPVLTPWVVVEIGDRHLVATVEFNDAHLGGPEAVHGGVITLFFDEFLGIFVGLQTDPDTRTAYLKVDYRRVTPANRKLTVTATINSVEGRKTLIRGQLKDGDELLAEAEGLFIRLRPDLG